MKTILIHLDEGASCRPRLAAALTLAREHDAHLSGLYPIPCLISPAYWEVPLPAEIYQSRREQALAAAQKNRQWFERELRRAGHAGDWRQAEDGTAEQLLGEAAAGADLLVLSQKLGNDPLAEDAALPGRAVLRSPAPVLVVPEQGVDGAIGRRVAIAWNDSREAARALADALPLLARAERVWALSAGPPEAARTLRVAELLAYLRRHGVDAEAAECAGDGAAGARLLARAASLGCDLLVMGAYGHSRLREAVFGGVTRHLLGNTTLPLLLSH